MKIISLPFFNNKGKSTEEVLAGCRKGDASCQEVLFKKYAPLIMTVCRRYEYAGFGASDILQESFILIFKNISSFDSTKASLETWMKKIAVNTALKVLRKRKMNFLEIDDHHIQIRDTSNEPIDPSSFSEEFLLKKIKELPDGYRSIFNLFVIEGYSHKEIAGLLEISVQTSKSQLSKAKKLLRKKLSDNIAKPLNKKNVKNF